MNPTDSEIMTMHLPFLPWQGYQTGRNKPENNWLHSLIFWNYFWTDKPFRIQSTGLCGKISKSSMWSGFHNPEKQCDEDFCQTHWSPPQKDWQGPWHNPGGQDFLVQGASIHMYQYIMYIMYQVQGASPPIGCKILAPVGSPGSVKNLIWNLC